MRGEPPATRRGPIDTAFRRPPRPPGRIHKATSARLTIVSKRLRPGQEVCRRDMIPAYRRRSSHGTPRPSAADPGNQRPAIQRKGESVASWDGRRRRDPDRRLYDILQGHFRTLPSRIGPATRNSRGRLPARIGHQSGERGDGAARPMPRRAYMGRDAPLRGQDSVSGAPIGGILRFTTPSRPDAAGARYVTLWPLPQPDSHR